MDNKTTGIILAGGKSSRMGEDKAFITCSGKALIEILIDKLSALFEDLLIVTNKPDLYQKYDIEARPDLLKDRGPLGGIYTGLRHSKTKHAFVAACDMPYLNQDLVRFISGRIDDHDVVMPEYKGWLEPLCAIYSTNCITPIEKQLSAGNLKITDFLQYVKVRIIDEKDIDRFDPEGLSFVNINTPEDLREFRE